MGIVDFVVVVVVVFPDSIPLFRHTKRAYARGVNRAVGSLVLSVPTWYDCTEQGTWCDSGHTLVHVNSDLNTLQLLLHVHTVS